MKKYSMEMSRVITKQMEKIIREVLDSTICPIFVIIFGSYAKGTTRVDSDLDIAYFTEKKHTDYERFSIAGELSSKLNVEVDLIDIRKIDTVFAAQIYSTGELLYCTNEPVFFKERIKIYSMYATLNEQRSEILEEIKRRGKVYGE